MRRRDYRCIGPYCCSQSRGPRFHYTCKKHGGEIEAIKSKGAQKAKLNLWRAQRVAEKAALKAAIKGA